MLRGEPIGPDSELARRVAVLSPQRRSQFEKALRRRLDASVLIRPRPDRGSAPASFGQQRMWLLTGLTPQAYNYGTAVRLRGRLVVPALRAAVERVVIRHEVLRTTFELVDDLLTQIVHQDSTVPFRVVDLRTDERALPELLRTESRHPFDLATGPLLRVTLFRIDQTDHVVLLAIHHAVTDGWSNGVLVAELAAGYRELVAGRPCSRPPLPVQYGDYAHWQRENLVGEELESLTEFWSRTTRDLPMLALPYDRFAENLATDRSEGATYQLQLPEVLSHHLQDLRERTGGSLFMLVLAALVAVLRAITGQSDLVIGTLVSGRQHPELAPLIGYFVNLVVLRVDAPGEDSFRQLWARVRDQVTAAIAHQDLPYEKLLELMRGDGRAQARSPIRLLCVAQQTPPELSLPGVHTADEEVELRTAQFDLMVEMHQDADGLRLAFQYDVDVFGEPTLRLIGEHLQTVLERVESDPDQRCADLLLDADLLEPLPIGGDETLAALFEAQVVRAPDAIALVDGKHRVSYRTLNERANRLGRYLRRLGVRPEHRVALCLPRSVDSVTSMLAVFKAGAAWVVLDPDHPPAWLAKQVADAGPACLVTTTTLRARCLGFTGQVVCLDGDEGRLASMAGTDLGLTVHPDNVAYLIYTSGSTGTPKGVLGTHRGVVNRLRWMEDAHPFQAGEVGIARTPLSFVDSVAETFGPLLAGIPLVMLPPDQVIDPEALVSRLAEERVSRLVVVPSLLAMMLDTVSDLDPRLPVLRLVVTSGELLGTPLARRFVTRLPGRTLLNLYGSSETAADATAADITAAPAGATASIGRPLPGVTVVVRDGQGRRVLPLMPGELHLGGRCLARGYHGQPAHTAAAFIPDLTGQRAFRSGDLVRQRADGTLEYLGRKDRQLQVRGHRVEPAEVEQALLRHPEVRAAAVLAHQDAAGTVTLTGYVQPVDERPELPGLVEFLGRWLPGYLVPSRFVVMPALPLTASGKIDRLRLSAPEATAEPAGTTAPCTRTEVAVAAAFAELLAVPATNVHEDFFVSGGHSVLAARLVAVLRQRHGLDAGLRDIFDAPTIAGLANRIDARGGSGPAVREAAAERPLVADPAARHQPFPLTDVQQAYYVGRDRSLDLGAVSTHGYLEIDAPGLDLDRFTSALRALIARHPMLRAVVEADHQRVLESVPPYVVAVQDLRACTEADERSQLGALRAEMSHQVLPAGTWPLFDVRVSLRRAGAALLHISLDALICDAYSFGLLMAELACWYAEPHRELPALEVGFRDYVIAEAAGRDGDRHVEGLAYWRARIPDLPGGPELPLAMAPGDIDMPRFERRRGRLPARRWALLKSHAADAGLSASGVLLAAFAEVITAWSRRSHYVLTLTLFNRRPVHPQIDRVVGDFTSLTLLEIDHTSPGPFLARARAVQRRLWEDLDHSMVSGVTVMREWALHHRAAPGAVTPVVFTSNLPVAGDPLTGQPTLGELRYGITQTPQVGLDHQVSEHHGELVFNWDAIGELFGSDVLDDMFMAYQALLCRLVDDPDAWDRPAVLPLPLRQQARRERVNDTAAPLRPQCLHELVAGADHRIAVVDGTIRMTYRELRSRARRLGRTLRHLGVVPNTLVAVTAPKGWQQLVAVLGILESGAAFLPLDPELPAERMRSLLRRGEVQFALTQLDRLDDLPHVEGVRALAVDDDSILGDLDAPLQPAQCATDLAYVIFTSGSTGEPKGVMIDHRGAVNTINCVNRRFRVGPDDRVLAVSSLSFDLAVYDVFGVLGAGGTVVMPNQERWQDPRHWAELVSEHGVTIWNSVPAVAAALVDYAEALAGDALASLRVLLLSGDWIPTRLPDRIRTLVPEATVVSLGGATEGSIWSVWYPIGTVDPEWRSIPYGVPMDNQTMHVFDAELRPRPDRVPGELYIGGAGVALGYWRDTDGTRRAFPTHPGTGQRLYRTGDIARYLPDGTLEFLGREDHQVKISGYRVELAEVEAALARVDGVRAGAVVAVGEPRGDKRLVGFFVPVAADDPTPVAVRQRLADLLPRYMVPPLLVACERIPLTGSGKVDRATLLDLARRREPACVAGDTAEPADSARMEQLRARLCTLWQDVLALERVTSSDDFFLLGGTSVVAIRLITAVQQVFGVQIPLTRLFTARTVAELAELVAAAQHEPASESEPVSSAATPADSPQRYAPFPLTEVQQAYWLGRRVSLALGGVATHAYFEVEIEDIDPARLERALQRLIDRHDALRIVIDADGWQRVLPEVPAYRVVHRDLSTVPPAQRETELGLVRDQMSHAVHDPASWPLFAVRTHQIARNRIRLHVSLDLLIADAYSMRILIDELIGLYERPGDELPALTYSFRDYVLAVADRPHSEAYRRALAYWQAKAAQLPPAPGLPLLCGPDDLDTPRFERLTGELAAEQWSALHAWATGSALTPSALACAVFCEVLAAWSGSSRFTLNLTTFNRLPLHPEVDRLVGEFSTTTLLAVDLAGRTFCERAQKLQAQLWDDLEHRMVSGVEVLRMLRRDPRRRDDALMPIVFTSTLMPADADAAKAAPAWHAEPVFAISQTPQVLLDAQISEVAGRLVTTWDYVPAAFPPGLVEQMFDASERLLADLAAQALETGGARP